MMRAKRNRSDAQPYIGAVSLSPKQRENSNPVLFSDKRGFPEERAIADYSVRRRTSQMIAAQVAKAPAVITSAHLNIVFKPGRTEVLQA
jgi:hypothetical protein